MAGGSFWNGCLNISPGSVLPVQTICANLHSVSTPFVSLKSEVSRVRGRGGGGLAEEKVQQDVGDGHIKAFRTQRRGAHWLILVYNTQGITFLWLILLRGHMDTFLAIWGRNGIPGTERALLHYGKGQQLRFMQQDFQYLSNITYIILNSPKSAEWNV